ncbi:uncharacterized protein LOC132034580 [Lycium ferocissimum]|uniref:uncharacterized protein LOC132034580 n=1 Tax=Lycium ferocissimum TaxID=112874 RepID=UPI0028152049|nr:uncharacterized protein LOC132034580 [Lycium ferocissimum]
MGRTLMDSKKNEIKFRVNDEEETFQASKGIKLPSAYKSISVIDVIDKAVDFKMDEERLDKEVVEDSERLEEDSTPNVEHQRRLNPPMQEVVKKEIIKWLDAGVFYSIIDSKWVRPVQCVPKKGDIIEMLDQVGGRPYYCFLDGYSGYNQINIALEDQEKTTFTCSYGTFSLSRMSFGVCNAPVMFQQCMMSIFSDKVEDFLEVFMDDFFSCG